jgi:hypothetical protein
MKRIIVFLVAFHASCVMTFAQVAISTDNAAPDPSAMLEVKSTTKGLLAPQMTFAERNAIVSPATGLVVICTNCSADGTGVISIYLEGKWQNLSDTCDLPFIPVEGIHVQSNTQITWNWSTVPIATGYKWDDFIAFELATDLGNVTTLTETGLTQGTSYSRYVWAYNACGNNYFVELRGQALTCGSSFTITHTAGTVAPDTKTVTYGTVTNIPGETTKCWITQNLGAAQQASTVDDASEASAGWYWQFNLRQGYKHDGTTLTPAWTITGIDEDFVWNSANDPCLLLLGSAWRIPTLTEWTNVNTAGNWTNWTGPFTSGLHMHAAGYLNRNTGAITNRGANGYYWSITQHSTPRGWDQFFSITACFQSNDHKATGFPIRCIRD